MRLSRGPRGPIEDTRLGLLFLKGRLLQKCHPRVFLSGIQVLKSLKINGFPLRNSAGMTRKRVLQEPQGEDLKRGGDKDVKVIGRRRVC